MVVRIALNILRLTVLVNLVLGILFWTGNADSLQNLHMLLGILAVASLFTIAIIQSMNGGSLGLTLAACTVGVLLAIVGIFQQSWLLDANHWIIQVIHLILGISAIGLGEMMGGQYKRMRAMMKAA